MLVSYGSIYAVNHTVHGFAGTNSNHGTGLLGKAMLLAPKHAGEFRAPPCRNPSPNLPGSWTPS